MKRRACASGYAYAMLAFYAERLPTVEINNTFYRMPKREVLAKWADATPADFRFAIKASKCITHDARLEGFPNGNFDAAAAPLALLRAWDDAEGIDNVLGFWARTLVGRGAAGQVLALLEGAEGLLARTCRMLARSALGARCRRPICRARRRRSSESRCCTSPRRAGASAASLATSSACSA
jgi:hypothetical protein